MNATHIYTGPTTIYGLRKDTPCIVLGKGNSGLVRIETAGGERWQVARTQISRPG